ncbi:unnamed protein product, partial [Vitis vinifera]
MGSPPICGGTLLGFWVFLLFSVIFCYGSADQFEVVGVVECADCSESRIKASPAFSGLGVTIDCKLANGEFKTRAVGDVSNEGKFKVSLPEEMVKDGYQLKEECFAQLHSASAAPCPDAQSGLEASKIVLKAKTIGKKNVFGPIANLKFSSLTCTSALWWSFYKHPPLPKLPLPFPKAYPPPWKKFGHVYKKPLPPSIPIYKKPLPSPVHKKLLPPKVLIHKKPLPPKVLKPNKPFPPPSPVYKKPFPPSLLPPHVPIYKKPLLPPTPIYNKPNPPPFYKWSIHKPIPPVYKLLPPIPPLYKKPCPPILKPPHYLPKLPPKLFPFPNFCYGNADQVQVVGIVECADCSESHIKASQAFSGLGVTIDCKLANGEFKTRAFGVVSNEGKFKVSLPEEMVKDGYQLKEECFAQLHSASAAPCSDAQSGLKASKIVLKAKTIGKKNDFGPIENLKFSSLTCTSALWWSFYKHPPLPKLPLPFPKAYPPPWKKFGHVYKKPLPPSIPIYKKPLPSPVHKKLLPPKVLIHKKPLPPKVLKPNKPFPPPSPVYKKPFPPSLLPPHVPIYKKPLLPPTPIYNKPNPPPFYKWSIHKIIPPVYKLLPPIPPLYKKPCPPILKPPHYLPKLPPKHFPLPNDQLLEFSMYKQFQMKTMENKDPSIHFIFCSTGLIFFP